MNVILTQAIQFLLATLFDLYIFILLLRLLLALAHANYWHPLTQFVIRLTNPVIKPLRSLLPNVRGLEISSVVMIVVLEVIKFTGIYSLGMGFASLNFSGILFISIADGLHLLTQLLFFAIIFQALISWLQPYSPIQDVLNKITQPIMKPFQSMIKPINGIDLSPIAALISIHLIGIVLIEPINQLGLRSLGVL